MNTDGKEQPIQFQSAEEFQSRQNYVTELICKTEDLEKIIGKYEFSKNNAIRCQLMRCNQMHQNGFVIRTKDGRETNCGNKCGEREFGISFKELVTTFNKEREVLNRKYVLSELIQKKEEYKNLCMDLSEKSDNASKKVSAIYTEIQRHPQLLKAFRDALKKDGKVQIEKTIDKNTQEAFQEKKYAKSYFETIAVVLGIRIFTDYKDKDFKKELKFKVEIPISDLEKIELDSLTNKQLKAKSSEINKINEVLVNASGFIKEAERFTSKDNIENILELKNVVPERFHINPQFNKAIKRLSHIHSLDSH